MEAEVIARSSRPLTVAGLVPQLRAAGLPAGGTVLVRSAPETAGAAYGEVGGPAVASRVGLAGTLVPLVDFATGWFRSHRR
ncbi:MAG TPA: hypothetical protein VI357_25495 [Mycobacteriales bacterium]